MRSFFIISCFATLAGTVTACGTVEVVGRPPSAVEIARINESVAHGHDLVIEGPVEVIAPAAPTSRDPASVPPRRAARPIVRSIAVTDGREMTFNQKRGAPLTLPLDAIDGVRVRATDRGRSAALGMFIGVGAAAVAWGALALVASHWGGDDPDAMRSTGCNTTCGTFIAGSVVAALIAGGIAGYAIGAPHRFVFGGGATRR